VVTGAVAEDVELIVAGPDPPEPKAQLQEDARDLASITRRAQLPKNKQKHHRNKHNIYSSSFSYSFVIMKYDYKILVSGY
jgi:hypothetical protein